MNWGLGGECPEGFFYFSYHILVACFFFKFILGFQLYICGRKDPAYLLDVLKLQRSQCTTDQREGSQNQSCWLDQIFHNSASWLQHRQLAREKQRQWHA